jgi:hypothetical protein
MWIEFVPMSMAAMRLLDMAWVAGGSWPVIRDRRSL